MISRYGDSIERDLIFSTHLTLRDFGPGGSQGWSTMANLIQAFMNMSKSHLSAAMALDMDLFESRLDEDGNLPVEKPGHPPLTEIGTVESLLMTLIELIQANNHYSANQKGKPKITRIERPLTAEQLYYEKLRTDNREDIWSVVRFADDAD